jgi:hypothetical protein
MEGGNQTNGRENEKTVDSWKEDIACHLHFTEDDYKMTESG